MCNHNNIKPIVKNNKVFFECSDCNKDIHSIINANFIIRYNYTDNPHKTYLVASGQYHLVGCENLKIKHFKRVLNSKLDITTIKLRRGLKIDFLYR